MRIGKKMAAAILAAAVIAAATGCDAVKEFSADSLQSLGSKVSDTVDSIGDTLGIGGEGEDITPEPVHTDRVYEIAQPKPTLTADEKEAEQKKREDILRGVNEYFAGRPTAVPADADGPDEAAEKEDGKTGKKDKDRSGKKDAEPSASPVPTAQLTGTPAATPTLTPTSTPTPAPTQKPKATPTPVPDDDILDW